MTTKCTTTSSLAKVSLETIIRVKV